MGTTLQVQCKQRSSCIIPTYSENRKIGVIETKSDQREERKQRERDKIQKTTKKQIYRKRNFKGKHNNNERERVIKTQRNKFTEKET